jgi:hypothetical protein
VLAALLGSLLQRASSECESVRPRSLRRNLRRTAGDAPSGRRRNEDIVERGEILHATSHYDDTSYDHYDDTSHDHYDDTSHEHYDDTSYDDNDDPTYFVRPRCVIRPAEQVGPRELSAEGRLQRRVSGVAQRQGRSDRFPG